MNEGSSAPPRTRPGWVWAIFLFYVVTTGWGLIFRALVWLGLYQMPAIIRNQSLYSYLFGVAHAALSLTAATMLWLLRRQAVPLFYIATAVTVCEMIWQVFSGGRLDQLMSQSTLMLVSVLIGMLFGLLMPLAICLYTWMLRQRGVLH